MAWLTLAEAAMQSGFSVELVESLTKRCPKSGQDRKLPCKDFDGVPHVDDGELLRYRRYLREPWPVPKSGGRPHIPKAIADDVRAESHHECAICGRMDNGELAHIDAVAGSLNNSPDNLLLLCPNHHTKYDLGHRPNTNITRTTILAAKEMKRASRTRMLRYEGNTAKLMRTITRMLEQAEVGAREADEGSDSTLDTVYLTQIRSLTKQAAALAKGAHDAAAEDREFTEAETELAKIAPALMQSTSVPGQSIRRTAQEVVAAAAPLFADDFDDVDCPHCGGRGQTGLLGDLCAYCHGEGQITAEKAAAYEPDLIDEVDCPHCHGRGQTGVMGHVCSYCGGRCVVSHEKADDYDLDSLDEVDCPRCGGRGELGIMSGRVCDFCLGRQRIPRKQALTFDPGDVDEVDCPHCHGRGQTGVVGDGCSYCGTDQQVSPAKAEAYDRDTYEEIECPRCDGSGLYGAGGHVCRRCHGRGFVNRD